MEQGAAGAHTKSRRRWVGLASVVALVVIAAGVGARAVADGSEVSPFVPPGVVFAPSEPATTAGATLASVSVSDWLDGTLRGSGDTPIATESIAAELEAPSATAAATTVAEATAATLATAGPVVAPPSAPTAAPPARTAPPAPPAAPTAAPATCPATWFCYPRLGIAGPIVPYTDCSGGTDVGGGIRSYSCLSDNYLMGHAYTQFGLVRQWVAGDTVFAWGKRFTVTGAVTEQSCAAPSFPLATLSMQTSLTSSACGAVLVVQAR